MRVGLVIAWFPVVLAAGCTLRAVPVDAVQAALREDGAYLGIDLPTAS
jgi:hypothetical protein